MKKNVFSVLAFLIVLAGLYFVLPKQTAEAKEIFMADKKVLVVYFSHTGNTRVAAEIIQGLTNADIFEIVPLNPYPTNYKEVVEQAEKEKNGNILPEMKANINDLSKYDVIFIGTPVWWYTAAPVVKTFLSQNNFDGKIIAPFCTHGGGGASSTYSDIKKLAPNATVTEGYTTFQRTADDKSASEWIKRLKF